MSSWRENVSQDTIRMVEDLISLKNNKIDDPTKTKNMYLTIVIISMLLFIVFFLFIMLGPQDDILQTISTFFFNTYNQVWLGITGYFYWQSLQLEREIKVKKTSFENLRLEVIEHLKNSWYINEQTATRDAISDELEQHGINVRYKSK